MQPPNSDMMPQWRPMRPADIADVHALATTLHPDFPEDAAIFAEKLALFADGCFTLAVGETIQGYCYSHPWTHGTAPPLNAILGRLPAPATTYFVHDIAVAKAARGHGAAQQGVTLALAVARRHALAHASLVSVNRTERFWRRLGFTPVASAPQQQAVRGKYGDGAVLMERVLVDG